MPHEVLVPPLGQTTDTVVLSAWYKVVGDQVKEGEPLFAIETDKATLDIEAQASGVLTSIRAQPGDSVAVLSTIAVIAAPGEQRSEGAREHGGVGVDEAVRQRYMATSTSPTASLTRRGFVGERIFVSPRARRLAEAEGVAWQTLMGTGPEGAIVERDVRKALASLSAHPAQPKADHIPAAVPAPQSPIPNPPSLTAEIEVSALLILQQRLARREIAVTLIDIVLYLLGYALREQPVLAPAGAHVGLVLVTDQGFTSPVVRNVDAKRLGTLARETSGLLSQARAGALRPEDQDSASILLADLGVYGVDSFTPTAGLPDIPTLGLGRVHARRGEETAWLSLSYSPTSTPAHIAIRFFQRVVQLIEDPDLSFA
jgi:pyruvate dehydrogenase E2 component (dihydrolipoamide acetyltransferase)